MSLIKSYVFSIQEMGFDPYHLNKLSSEEWDNLLTKALKSDRKLYETLILTRCKLKLEKDNRIAMYCTGGIRCEKASAFMRKKGYKNVAILNLDKIQSYIDKKNINPNEVLNSELLKKLKLKNL